MGENAVKNRAEIKQDTIDHYNRMIAFARTRTPENIPDKRFMGADINEDWFYRSYPYCNKWLTFFRGSAHCTGCPLFDSETDCVHSSRACCSGLWVAMARARTWREWIERAEAVLQFIRERG